MTTVKWLHSGMPGAPTLNGQAGSLLAVFDACLVNGWGSAVVDSIVVVSNVATVTKSGHPFEPQQVVEIAGAAPAGLNGQKRVLTTTGSTYTFDATGISNQTATGVITHKVAPLGWTKPFATAGNVAAYRISAVDGTGAYLRMDDSGTLDGRAVAYESMSDVNTGVGPFPTAVQLSGGAYWTKSGSADANARQWMIVGDSCAMYMTGAPYNNPAAERGALSQPWRGLHFFGDINSVKAVDPYRAVHHAWSTAAINTTNTGGYCFSYLGVSSYRRAYAARGSAGVGSSVGYDCSSVGPVRPPSGRYSGSASDSIPFPNPADNGLYVVPFYLNASMDGYRGTLPGCYSSPQDLFTGVPFQDRGLVSGVSGFPGRSLMAALLSNGAVFFDVTGPWR
jgi:hypothetical protein